MLNTSTNNDMRSLLERAVAAEDEKVCDPGPDIGVFFATHTPCEILVQLLPNSSFPALRELMASGLNVDEFVEVLSGHVAQLTPSVMNESEIFETNLRALFSEIDVNNNGDVDWEEFSHHVLHTTQVADRSGGATLSQDHRTCLRPCTTIELSTNRVRNSKFSYIDQWGYYVLTEAVQGAVDRGRITIYKQNHNSSEVPLEIHSQVDREFVVDAFAHVTSLDCLATASVNGRLQYLSLSADPLLDERGQLQRLTVIREQHLAGRHPVLEYDPEMNGRLLAGGANGKLSIIDPTDQLRAQPTVVHSADLHTQPIVALLPLPERGSKKIVSAGLDSRMILYDPTRSETLSIFGKDTGTITDMSYSEEHSLLVTVSQKELDPILWTPHAVSNPFVKRLEAPACKRSKLIQAECVPGSPYCITADVLGLIKIWDLRKLGVAAMVNCESQSTATSKRVWCRNFAVDPHRFEVVAAARTESGNCLFTLRPTFADMRNPRATDDTEIIAIEHIASLGWILTCSAKCVKVWDIKKGQVVEHLTDFWPDEAASGGRGKKKGGKKSSASAVPQSVSAFTVDPHGRRFYLGTFEGTVSMHSTATGGQLTRFLPHEMRVTHLKVMKERNVLVSGAADHIVHVHDLEADPPLHLMTIPLERSVPLSSLTVHERVNLVVMGDIHGTQFDFDVSPGVTKPAAAGHVAAYVDPTAGHHESKLANGDVDVSTFVNPAVFEVSCSVSLDPVPAVVSGDTRGFLQVNTVRPSPVSHMRLARWKSFSPKASGIVFAVALALLYDAESETLFVGDDQGNVTMWDLADVLQSYNLVACRFPSPATELLELKPPVNPPNSVLPKLKGFFPVHSGVMPIRSLCFIPETDILVSAAETAVCFWTLSGRYVATLMQGTGTVLDHTTDPFDIDAKLEQIERIAREQEELDMSNYSPTGSFRMGSRGSMTNLTQTASGTIKAVAWDTNKPFTSKPFNRFVAMDPSTYMRCWPRDEDKGGGSHPQQQNDNPSIVEDAETDIATYWRGASDIEVGDNFKMVRNAAPNLTSGKAEGHTPPGSPAKCYNVQNRMKGPMPRGTVNLLGNRVDQTLLSRSACDPSSLAGGGFGAYPGRPGSPDGKPMRYQPLTRRSRVPLPNLSESNSASNPPGSSTSHKGKEGANGGSTTPTTTAIQGSPSILMNVVGTPQANNLDDVSPRAQKSVSLALPDIAISTLDHTSALTTPAHMQQQQQQQQDASARKSVLSFGADALPPRKGVLSFEKSVLSPTGLQKELVELGFGPEGENTHEDDLKTLSPETDVFHAVFKNELAKRLQEVVGAALVVSKKVVVFNRPPSERFNPPSLSSVYSTTEVSSQMDWVGIVTHPDATDFYPEWIQASASSYPSKGTIMKIALAKNNDDILGVAPAGASPARGSVSSPKGRSRRRTPSATQGVSSPNRSRSASLMSPPSSLLRPTASSPAQMSMPCGEDMTLAPDPGKATFPLRGTERSETPLDTKTTGQSKSRRRSRSSGSVTGGSVLILEEGEVEAPASPTVSKIRVGESGTLVTLTSASFRREEEEAEAAAAAALNEGRRKSTTEQLSVLQVADESTFDVLNETANSRRASTASTMSGMQSESGDSDPDPSADRSVTPSTPVSSWLQGNATSSRRRRSSEKSFSEMNLSAVGSEGGSDGGGGNLSGRRSSRGGRSARSMSVREAQLALKASKAYALTTVTEAFAERMKADTDKNVNASTNRYVGKVLARIDDDAYERLMQSRVGGSLDRRKSNVSTFAMSQKDSSSVIKNDRGGGRAPVQASLVTPQPGEATGWTRRTGLSSASRGAGAVDTEAGEDEAPAGMESQNISRPVTSADAEADPSFSELINLGGTGKAPTPAPAQKGERNWPGSRRIGTSFGERRAKEEAQRKQQNTLCLVTSQQKPQPRPRGGKPSTPTPLKREEVPTMESRTISRLVTPTDAEAARGAKASTPTPLKSLSNSKPNPTTTTKKKKEPVPMGFSSRQEYLQFMLHYPKLLAQAKARGEEE